MRNETPVDALMDAIERAGGQSALATKLSKTAKESISHARVWNWINRGKKAPAELCPLIERVTGVACERLRPDVDWAYLRSTAASELTKPAPSATPKEVSHG